MKNMYNFISRFLVATLGGNKSIFLSDTFIGNNAFLFGVEINPK
jgi:hypothetical protein